MLVVKERPLGVDAVLGMNSISALGGVIIKSATEVHCCGGARQCAAALSTPLVVDAINFTVWFNEKSRAWTVSWKWTNETVPGCLNNILAEYNVCLSMQQEFNEELDSWIANGWLTPYDDNQYGTPKGLVPLMAIHQNSCGKVRPVLDCCELNSY